MAENAAVATLESKKDQGTDAADRVKYWRAELDAADAAEKDWRKDAKRVYDIYRGEGKGADKRAFNILYPTVETLRPALYNQTPTPDVRRRFKKQDPVGKAAAEVVEGALTFDIDNDDLDILIDEVVQDALVVGRGVPWVDYDAVIAEIPSDLAKTEAAAERESTDEEEPGESEESVQEELADERVPALLIDWPDFRMSPAKSWKKVRWVARALYPTRDECVEKFGQEIGEKIPLNTPVAGMEDKSADDGASDAFKRAKVWQIWSKEEKKVIHLAEGMNEQLAKEEADPLNLRDFFPCPCPLYRIKANGSMVPKPEYLLYEEQARELEIVSRRIIALTKVLKARGWRAADAEDLDKIEDLADGQLAPVVNWQQFAQAGGIEKAIAWMPIQQIAAVLVQLYDARERIKTVIYEITGQADIMRGAGDPRETATAQKIKGRYGGLRLQKSQRSVQRMVRDLIRIKAEIISEKFAPETLQAMTGVDLPTGEQKQMAVAAIQTAQQTGQPVPPAVEAIAQKPSWDEVMAVLRSDPLRNFRIDIETDSTIQPDAAEEQKNRVEFLTAITQLITGLAPLVGGGALPIDTAREMINFGARAFKVGTQLEDALDQIGRGQSGAPGPQGQPGQPDPQAQAAADAAAAQAETQGKLEIEKAQAEADAAVNRQKAQDAAALEREKVQAANEREMFKTRAAAWLELVKAQSQAALARELEMIKAGVVQPGATTPFMWPTMPDFSTPAAAVDAAPAIDAAAPVM